VTEKLNDKFTICQTDKCGQMFNESLEKTLEPIVYCRNLNRPKRWSMLQKRGCIRSRIVMCLTFSVIGPPHYPRLLLHVAGTTPSLNIKSKYQILKSLSVT